MSTAKWQNIAGSKKFFSSIICSIFVLQVEDAIMQQQVESYKHAIRDWDEQQQRHRVALQQVK